MKESGHGSMPLKILAFFLSGVFFAGIIFSLCIVSMSSLFGIRSGAQTFYDSPLIRDLVIDHADDIVSSYINLNDGDYMSMNVYDEEMSNISYTLYAPKTPGSLALEKKAENYLCEKSGYTKTLVYHTYNLQPHELRKLGFDPDQVSSSNVIVRIVIRISDPIRAADDFYYYSRRFETVRRLTGYVPYLLVLSAAGLLAALYFLFASAGRGGGERYRLSWFDRIPYEFILAAAGLAGICFLVYMAESFSSYSLLRTRLMYEMMIILFPAWYCLILFLMTTLVRIKTGTLLSGTLLYMAFRKLPEIGDRLNHLISLIPSMTIALALTAGWLGVRFLMVEARESGLLVITDAVTAVLFLWLVRKAQVLENAGKQLAEGNMEFRIMDPRKMPLIFRNHARDLNSAADGIEKAINEKMRSERLRTELITNVSHDIKTPLTSIINYVDLLNKEHTEEEEKAYLEVLNRQTQRLKQLTEDVIDASKASSGAVEVHMGCVNISELIGQALAEYEEKLQAAELEVIRTVKDEPLLAFSDGRLLWRVLSNLLSNCAKYAMPGTRVYVEAGREGKQVYVSVKNISRDMLNVSADELVERFVRGDASRHTEGSGLGLNISESLVRLLGGTFRLTVDGDLFKVSVCLPAAEEES